MPRKSLKKIKKTIKIETYSHAGKKRKNNPPVGLVSSQTDKLNGYTKYEHDPYIDPYLSWAGKKENQEVNVRNISLHVHERIDATRIIKAFLKKTPEKMQPSLFETEGNELPLGKAFEFYSHDQDWTNRLIAGDSLLVMNSLLKKEGMSGEVQVDEDLIELFTGVESLPFGPGEHKKVAVKIIDDRGIESFVIKNLN